MFQGGYFMSGKKGSYGGFFGTDTEILFFIIVFLLLFWGCTGPACS
jgi:hypothetical protein